jgi:hypothetical protein
MSELAPHKRIPMPRSKNRFRLADRPADYKRLGISPVEIAEFEDGQRIDTEKGHYEWWYFDAHLDNGATVVVVFYTKPNVSPNGPLAPKITINIALPAGPNLREVSRHQAGAIQRIEVRLRRQNRDEPLRRRSQSLPYHGSHRGDIGRDRIDGRGPRLASQVRSFLFWCRRARKTLCLASRYTYHDADTSYVVSFERQTTILQAILTDRAPLLKRIIAG